MTIRFFQNYKMVLDLLKLGLTIIKNHEWSNEVKSSFIECLLELYPLSPIFYCENTVVDGMKRLEALQSFIRGEFHLTGLQVLSEYNGLFFSELPIPKQRRIRETKIEVFQIDKHAPFEERMICFRKLNPDRFKLD